MPRLRGESQEQYLARTRPYPDTPRPYKVYTALLSQVDTSAPTAIVIENTLGITPTFSYGFDGSYVLTAAGTFTTNKTFALVNLSTDASNFAVSHIVIDEDTVEIYTYDFGAAANSILDRAPIEIRVYA